VTPRLAPLAILLGAALSASGCSSCRHAPDPGGSGRADGSASSSGSGAIVIRPASQAGDSGAPRPGMTWVPPGTLRAGTPPDRVPRVADEEPAGAPVEMGGFYIDLLPWPNEPNAIPTTAVTRDEAETLCESKQKRLCTELEWERACKGPDNTAYEYGDVYRKEPCGTGISLDQAARRPTGEHPQCKSKFGVMEMHGGAWEWTSSAWGRGTKDKDASQGVLRGGNSLAGELVGRCSNAIARDPTKKAPTMGFRCCAGNRSTAEVHLEQVGTPVFQLVSNKGSESLNGALSAITTGDLDPTLQHTWNWIPTPNEQLVIVQGCNTTAPVTARKCGFVVGRNGVAVAQAETGRDPPELTKTSDFRHLRMRSLDQRGVFSRTITYVYGKVELGDPKRP